MQKHVPQIHPLYHSIPFPNIQHLPPPFSQTSPQPFLLPQQITSYSLTLLPHQAKKLIPQRPTILPTTYIPPHAPLQNYNLIPLPKPTLHPNLKYLPLHLPQHNIRVNPISAPP
ncbi:SDR family oxidoreductase, partial [Staphylococcus epidermidis]|uniref:SDR family oxidoreductase n=1 Tax=Staphylococcus epidermidis TaxID=1282 RepID=UPI0037D9A19E